MPKKETKHFSKTPKKVSKKITFLFVFGFLLIFIIEWITIKQVLSNSIKEQQLYLQQIARSVSAAINPERIKSLTGSVADLQNTDYIRLQEQLRLVDESLTSFDVTQLYIMNKYNGVITFSVDSLPADSSLHTLPGVPYTTAPSGLDLVFIDAKPKTIGPYTDDWGTYVSTFVPIFDIDGRTLISVLGLDINSSVWHRMTTRQVTVPGLLSVVILLFYVITFMYFIRRQITNRQIRESEEKFRTITESALDAIVMMNNLGRIVLWNPAAERLFGWKKNEVIGKVLHDLITVKPEHRKSKNLSVFEQTGESPVLNKTLELPVKTKSGGIIDVELTIARTQIGGLWHAIGIMRDITERKKAAGQLQQRTTELERLNNAMVGRELKMIELKRKIEELNKAENQKK